MHFTTWHGLRRHVQFVCNTVAQDPADPDEEVEHRVRVHELLQYACCLNLEALSMNVELAAYFHTMWHLQIFLFYNKRIIAAFQNSSCRCL